MNDTQLAGHTPPRRSSPTDGERRDRAPAMTSGGSRSKRRRVMTRTTCGLALLFSASCASPPAYPARPYYPVQAQPPAAPGAVCPTPSVTTAPPAKTETDPVAILPIEDDDLFRAERAALRGELLSAVAKKAPELRLMPLADVDAALRPVTKSGQRCAFDRSKNATRAKRADLRWVDVEHVFFDKHEELWVVGHEPWNASPFVALVAPWSGKMGLVDHYRTAFAALERKPAAADGLAAILGRISRRGGVSKSGLELCEAAGFQDCSAETQSLAGAAETAARCFEGSLETSETLLVEGPTCELADLDDMQGARAKLEACVCGALASAMQNGKRRKISLHYQSPETSSRAEPEVRVVEVKTNLPVEEDWHSPASKAGDASGDRAVYRLGVEGLEELSEPLSRCNAKKSEILVADLDLAPSGSIERVRFVVGSSDKSLEACASKALTGRGFECTSDNLSSHARVVVTFDAPAPETKRPKTPPAALPARR